MILHFNRPTLQFILVLLLLTCSVSASAFTQRFSVQPPCIAPGTQSNSRKGNANNNNFLTYEYNKIASMPSLRVRGGAVSPVKTLFSTTANSNDDDGEKSEKLALEAVQSIQYCCKMCFAAVVADIITTFIDVGAAASLSWVDFVDVFDGISILVFGTGLWRISQLYFESFSNMEKRMEPTHLLELFRTMGRIWGVSALNLALCSVSLASSLPTHGGNGVFQFPWETVSSTKLSIATVGILFVGRFYITNNCEQIAMREMRTYDKMMAENGHKFQPLPNQALIREAGYGAYCNQAQCAGSFAMFASLTLLKWIVSFDGGIIGHIFSISDVLTPFTITFLLFTLNKALLRAAIAEVRGDSNKVNDDEIYNDLFVAQAGFYNNVAEMLKGATIFGLLPYIVGPAIPYIVKSLKHIHLFARLFEALGICM